MEGFLRTLEFSHFVLPNLHFDQVTTERVRQSLLDEISLARGMVQSGERIVSRATL
jgi:hypothetical protein